MREKFKSNVETIKDLIKKESNKNTRIVRVSGGVATPTGSGATGTSGSVEGIPILAYGVTGTEDELTPVEARYLYGEGDVIIEYDNSLLSGRIKVPDYGQILFPGLHLYGSDGSLSEMEDGGLVAMMYIPEFQHPARYLYVAKGNADASESAQMALWGPVDPPIRRSRIITPSTDSPVLLSKSADTVTPSVLGLCEFDTGGDVTLYPGLTYWITLQHDVADTQLNVLRIANRAQGPNASGAMANAQQLFFRASSGAPSYASNYGTVGTATLAGITWDAGANFTMPVLGLA